MNTYYVPRPKVSGHTALSRTQSFRSKGIFSEKQHWWSWPVRKEPRGKKIVTSSKPRGAYPEQFEPVWAARDSSSTYKKLDEYSTI